MRRVRSHWPFRAMAVPAMAAGHAPFEPRALARAAFGVAP
jgi:hypothetical protein